MMMIIVMLIIIIIIIIHLLHFIHSFIVSQIMSKSMMTWKHKKLSSPLRGISPSEAQGVAIRS